MHSKSIILGWLGALLTLIKPAFAWLIIVLIGSKHNALASACVFGLMISDIFDGVIFRKSTPEMQRRFGFLRRVADAFGDRLCIGLVVIAMIKMTDLPFYIYGVELVREIILISLVGYSWIVRRPIVEPNNISRTATFCTGLTAIAWLNSQQELSITLAGLTGLIGAVGLYRYYKTMMANTPDRRRG